MRALPPVFSPSRRRFLTGQPSDAFHAVRPPWSVAEFHALCTRCEASIGACPERILQRDSAGYQNDNAIALPHGEQPAGETAAP